MDDVDRGRPGKAASEQKIQGQHSARRWRTTPLESPRVVPAKPVSNGKRPTTYYEDGGDDMTSFAIGELTRAVEELTKVVAKLVPEPDPVVAFGPAQGWMVASQVNVESGEPEYRMVEPVVGFLVYRSGEVEALRAGGDGIVMPVDDSRETVFHRDRRVEPGDAFDVGMTRIEEVAS